MAKHSGISHALVVVVALIVDDILSIAVELVVGPEELEATIGAGAELLSAIWLGTVAQSTLESVLLGVVIVLLAFVWGYLYHLRRHGTGSGSEQRRETGDQRHRW